MQEQVPDLNAGLEDPGHPLRRQRQKVLRLSLAGMADAVEARGAVEPRPVDWTAHQELGRMECRYGRPLSDILRAPWAASRTILRFTAGQAEAAGLSSSVVQELAEVVVDWSDRISIAFSEGYNDESAARAGELETRRRSALEVALSDPPPTPEALATACRAAEWRMPRRGRVLVARGPARHDFRRRLPEGSLAADLREELCAILPEPFAGEALRSFGQAPETVAALGPPVALVDARHSAGSARRAIRLARDGWFERIDVVDCASLEFELVVLADAPAASSLSRRVLEPVLDKPELIATLAAWLATGGRPKATAQRLAVHPHTVSYRLNRLRDLLGPMVDDPDSRLQLHLAAFVALADRRRNRPPP